MSFFNYILFYYQWGWLVINVQQGDALNCSVWHMGSAKELTAIVLIDVWEDNCRSKFAQLVAYELLLICTHVWDCIYRLMIVQERELSKENLNDVAKAIYIIISACYLTLR